jgi:hypothetical protein
MSLFFLCLFILFGYNINCLTSNIKICYPHKKKQKGKNMNEQLANKIRSQLSGGESYDHFSPSSLNIPIQKYIISYVCSTQAMRRQNKVGTKLTAVI